MGKVIRELQRWWEAFCMAAPGQIGAKLRCRLFIKKSRRKITKVNIHPGVFVNGWKNMSYGDNLGIGRGCIFETTSGKIKIGKNVSFSFGVALVANEGLIEIGQDVGIGMNTVFRAANHRFDETPRVRINQQGHINGQIIVGSDVWIGANVTILPNAEIGDHCVIGAGAVVSGKIPTGSLAVGVPAKVVKKLESK